MDTPWTPMIPAAALAVPLVLAFASVAAPHRARLASAVALALAALFAVGASLADPGVRLGVRGDIPTRVMLLLVVALGAVVVRFSSTYLDGERDVARYRRWLLRALSAVTVLVITNSLLVIVVAWTATSLALHRLLTFYGDRPAARVAAHKKFVVSRLADAALVVALGLLHANVGSFDLDRIAAWVGGQDRLPLSMQVAAALVAVAVILRSAQLPFHGWITQVMEAPTPVSALLHAGVVNIGGFVLIRLAVWMSAAEPARTLLVCIGLATAIVAALVMTTRVSVKVTLAWSTSAQMGFMLVQCGLGLWPLALLHLVAHSLYKAHAFLGAGTAVEEWTARSLAPRRAMPAARRLVGATIASLGIAAVALVVVRPWLGLPALPAPAAPVLALLLGLSLVPLASTPSTGRAGVASTALRVVGVVLGYGTWHALAEHAFPAPAPASSQLGWWMTAVGFVGLFVTATLLRRRPDGALAHRLHPWLFAGLYLDELVTRPMFRLWPVRRASAPVPRARPGLAPIVAEVRS